MAKSMRSKIKKKFRATQRASVGERQMNKILRKTTRRVVKDIIMPAQKDITLEEVKEMLGGAGGASAALVTTEPAQKRKLRYTFNQQLRKERLEHDLEDQTDDEEEEEEYHETGAATAGLAAEIRERILSGAGGGSGAGGSGMDEDDEEDGPLESGVKKAADKPLPKRQMTTQHQYWADVDVRQPNNAGMYDVPIGKNNSKARKDARAAMKRLGGKKRTEVLSGTPGLDFGPAVQRLK